MTDTQILIELLALHAFESAMRAEGDQVTRWGEHTDGEERDKWRSLVRAAKNPDELWSDGA